MARWAKQAETEAPKREADHRCAFVGCGKPGSMSHGLQGAGPWYCRRHFFGTESAPRPVASLADLLAQERQRAAQESWPEA